MKKVLCVERRHPKFERFLEKRLSLVYGEANLPTPKVVEIDSKKRKLLSSMMSVGKSKRKAAKSSESGKKDGYKELKLK